MNNNCVYPTCHHAAHNTCVHSAADSQACASAAKAQIEVLEQAAEAAAVEHQQAMAAAEEVLAQAKLAAAQQLQQTEEQLNTACAKVQAELEATRVRHAAYSELAHTMRLQRLSQLMSFVLMCYLQKNLGDTPMASPCLCTGGSC